MKSQFEVFNIKFQQNMPELAEQNRQHHFSVILGTDLSLSVIWSQNPENYIEQMFIKSLYIIKDDTCTFHITFSK